MKLKSYELYNSQDLYNFWCEEYKKYHQKKYQFAGFIGNELKQLKELLQDNDIYSILLAIQNATKSEINITYFVNHFSEYASTTRYAKYLFYFDNSKNKEIVDQLITLLVLEGKWSPTPDDIIKMSRIVEELEKLVI